MSAITPEQADKILQTDLANIVRKAKEGKTLTTAERKVFERYRHKDQDIEWADSMSQAAELIPCALSVLKALKRSPVGAGAFKGSRVNVPAIRQILAENPGIGDTDGNPDYHLERALKTRVERQIKEIQRDQIRRELIHIDEVRAGFARLITAAKGQFLSLGPSITPIAMVRLGIGKRDADKLQKLIDERTRAVIENLSKNPWNSQPPSTPPQKLATRGKTRTKRKPSKKSPLKRT